MSVWQAFQSTGAVLVLCQIPNVDTAVRNATATNDTLYYVLEHVVLDIYG